ncbi:MAG: deoxyribonuclease IV [Pirellulales bacterium]|nr:deoxyribonuclease IV [Pirellulales bacterium]
MSIAGSYDRAVHRAHEVGCQCVQLFTKNNNQWKAKPITPEDAARFKKALAELGISHPIAHDSYLINLASPDQTLWKRSIDAMVVELRRAEILGIPYVVAHPGSYTSGTEAGGLRQIARALDEIHRQTVRIAAKCLLETTAGQGTSLGWQFEHLATILDTVQDPDRLGVCFDTSHVFAAGYPMGTQKDYRATMRALNQTVGVDRIKAFHLNDSLRDLGSRVDRHAHIGRGRMGKAPFKLLLADRRFRQVPMYLETPKGTEKGIDLDRINLRTLRRLAAV